MLSERDQTQKAVFCIMSFIRNSGKENFRDRKCTSGWELGGILPGDRTVLDLDSGGGGQTTVHFSKFAELYTEELQNKATNFTELSLHWGRQ